jgi:hypothetical protein
MRSTRPVLIAVFLAVLALAAAGCGSARDAPAPAPAPAAERRPAAPLPPSGPEQAATPAAAGKPDAKGATTTALGFVRELGMRDPVAGPFRSTGSRTGEVAIHPRREDGRPFDRPTTWVQLRRYANGWVVTGAQARNRIEVDQPLAWARIGAPVAVSGLASAYEGTVQVTVTEDRAGADRVLGRSFVNGGATELAPFQGRIAFSTPSADAGWLIFSGDSGGGGIFEATAVRVRFVSSARPAPRILGVRTTPALAASAGFLELSGSGTVVIRVDARNAERVRFLLAPSGTGSRPYAKPLGTDWDGRDGWSFTWRYRDEAFLGRLLVQATGPGGTAEHGGIGVVHS